jgi:hypothetical protein
MRFKLKKVWLKEGMIHTVGDRACTSALGVSCPIQDPEDLECCRSSTQGIDQHPPRVANLLLGALDRPNTVITSDDHLA